MQSLSISTWIIWAVVLIIQNFAFTFVSRARNSGSVSRHMVASFFYNGVWFLSQTIIFTQMFKIMKGDYGIQMAVFVGLYYTAFTMTGSWLAHQHALKTEKGKARVGAFKDQAQISKEEWEKVKNLLEAAEHGMSDYEFGPFKALGMMVLHQKLTGEAGEYFKELRNYEFTAEELKELPGFKTKEEAEAVTA